MPELPYKLYPPIGTVELVVQKISAAESAEVGTVPLLVEPIVRESAK